MKRLLYILLCLSLAFSVQGQALFFQHNQTVVSGGGGGCADADANAYIADVEAQSGLNLTTTQEDAICDLYTNLKAHGTYTKTNGLWVFAYANANANKVNLITLTPYITWTGSPTHGATGVVFDGTTQHGDLGIKPNIAAQNSAGLGVWIVSGATANDDWYIGTLTATKHALGRTTATDLGWGINRDITISSTTTQSQWLYATRTTSTATELYRNGVTVATLSVSSFAPSTTANIYIGGANNGFGPDKRAACTLLMAIQTDGLTDAEALSLYNDLNTFKTDMGL